MVNTSILLLSLALNYKSLGGVIKQSCPPGWRDYSAVDNLGCVQFVQEQLTWDQAAAECWSRDQGHLVSIVTDYQRIHLGQTLFLEDLSHHYWWVGATDRNSEGVWRWAHGCEEVDVSGWKDTEPAGGILENCAVQGGDNYHWRDVDCGLDMLEDLPIYAICQIN